jgi:crotonobetainyl-CoA:carnitine CoA-transferase CaiB-like acyl-CoA transferase
VSGPLAAIRVLEIGHMLAGPYCGLLLADLGADVIKIEPASGDIARRVSPHSIGPHNAYFASLNRNKRSVVIDLGTSGGQNQLHELCRTAHALVVNLRPSAIVKLGLTYAALQSVNPRLVCVALTGFGLASPLAERPAYDYIIQAMTGIMELTGEPDAPPTKTGYSAVDNSAGMMSALGLLAKIIEGSGGQIDVAMYDVMLSQLNYLASASLNAGEKMQRYAGSAHPYIVPAQVFPTRDGWLSLFITHDEFWRRFCEQVGQAAWTVDERFATMAARSANRDEVTLAIAAILATADTAEWLRRLTPVGVVAAGVESLEHALASEQTSARQMLVEIPTADGTIRGVGNPIRIDGWQAEYRVPPLLGEHAALLLQTSSGGN